jgi:hypothetical protein
MDNFRNLSRESKWLMFAPPECKTPEYLYHCIEINDSIFQRALHNFAPDSDVAIKAMELAVAFKRELFVEILKDYGVKDVSPKPDSEESKDVSPKPDSEESKDVSPDDA